MKWSDSEFMKKEEKIIGGFAQNVSMISKKCSVGK